MKPNAQRVTGIVYAMADVLRDSLEEEFGRGTHFFLAVFPKGHDTDTQTACACAGAFNQDDLQTVVQLVEGLQRAADNSLAMMPPKGRA